MVHKPVPRHIRRRINRLAQKEYHKQSQKPPHKRGPMRRAYKLMSQMENVDHREHHKRPIFTSIKYLGDRVRRIRVAENGPTTHVVVKHVHVKKTARKEIDTIKSIVKEHNKKHKNQGYRLHSPHAYTIPHMPELALMAYSDFPALREIRGIVGRPELHGMGRTKRGMNFWNALENKHGLDIEEFKKAAEEVTDRTKLSDANIIITGYSDGKFNFVPLIDLL